MAKEQTHFGFTTVDAEQKASLVGEVFSNVAAKYDIMNDLMSFGLHRWWKDQMVARIGLDNGCKILDMAGGTGDVAFRILKKAKKFDKKISVTVSDINKEMLAEGRARAIDRNLLSGISWKQADAENLPFKDQSFDYYTIAFGIRNVTHVKKALEEAYRVLKPGGCFLCLEFSHVTEPALASLYDAYSFKVIPAIGKLVTGKAEAYQYLVESIRQFPDAEKFAKMIRAAGFSEVKATPFHEGVVVLHTGWRL